MECLRTCLALLALVAGLLPAEREAAAQPVPPARPRVGLVLGGGGARGGAHLGVLEVLEEMRIPFDCVAGTSMGALVGGAFAAGITPPEMKALIARTDWTAMFDDSAGRESVNLRRKTIDDRFFSGLEFGVTKDGLRYREGAFAGEKIKLYFNELVRADLGERNIQELPMPLSLIATDIGTGERVAMRYGNLTSAMRASMSVPGVIAPVVRNGRKLVDGGLVDNVPIQEVRDLCGAEVVIAVNVGAPLLKSEEVSSVLSVVGQMVNLLTEQNVAKSLALLKPGDVYVRPELGDITGADFARQLEAAALGRAAMRGQKDKLAPLSVSEAQYGAWKERIRLLPGPTPPVIHEIQVAQTRFVNPQEIRDSIRQKEGEPLEARTLAEDLVFIYSQGDLHTLDYTVLHERDKSILRLTPVEKSWGPDYLRFGLNFSSDFRSDSAYNLRALYRRTWMNAFGGEWLTAAQIGSDQGLGTEFYQPLDYRQRWFVSPYLRYETRRLGIFFEGDRLAEYQARTTTAGLDVGANLGTYGQVRLGWLERNLRATRETGSTIFPNTRESVGALRADLDIDSYDFAFFPTRGYRVQAGYFDAMRTQSEFGRYAKAEAKAGAAYSAGDLILLGNLSGGRATRGVLPLADVFSLGGLGRLSAYAPGQILGAEYVLGSLQVQYRLNKPVPVLGLSAIAGLSLERGRMKDPITESTLTGWRDSIGLYVAANTPVGPVYMGYADAKGAKGRFYLFLGTP